MVDLIITGVRKYGNDVLKVNLLHFKHDSKLVLEPDQKSHTVPRSLTIIANKIKIDDNAEITYNLDERGPGPPYDPDDPAPTQPSTVLDGSNGQSFAGEGPYPIGNNGGAGGQGQSGTNGISGIHAPELEIFVSEVEQVDLDALKINFKGQDGGKGGKGGDGGNGGDGQKGATATASDSWYDGNECTREPGRGGNGGKGGSAGYPGRGGDGGNGSIIKVFRKSTAAVQGWDYIVDAGKAGSAGEPGKEGIGGTGGAQGDIDSEDACPVRSEYHGADGPLGESIDELDPEWQKNFKGKDGAKGEYEILDITGVPS